jgi:hypothetical protein
MNIDMNDDHIISVTQLTELLKHGNCVKFKSSNKKQTYEWVGKTLGKFRYFSESKKNRGIIKNYIITLTGYSEGQVDKLIKRRKKFGKVFLFERTQHTFPKKYEMEDVHLLSEVCLATESPNGNALKKMFFDSYHLYGDTRFERLKQISVSHIYNLQKTNVYRSKLLSYTKTKPSKNNIGERRKPDPNGKPGFLRVDSVHQGDLDKQKGVYHINLVDEVTQWEVVGCVEGISEYFLEPLLAELLDSFPFIILNFHSDNGGEYINKVVAQLLNKMSIDQTKSRSRKTNDNALVEGKNGAVIRKHMGYIHIPKKYAKVINEYYRNHFNPYNCFHRYCAFPTDYVSNKGKIKKKYENYMTPCQKLLSIPNMEVYLKDGVTKESLMREQMEFSHFEAAQKLQEEKSKLFKKM